MKKKKILILPFVEFVSCAAIVRKYSLIVPVGSYSVKDFMFFLFIERTMHLVLLKKDQLYEKYETTEVDRRFVHL